jgi:hypothetical protein
MIYSLFLLYHTETTHSQLKLDSIIRFISNYWGCHLCVFYLSGWCARIPCRLATSTTYYSAHVQLVIVTEEGKIKYRNSHDI